MISLSRADDQMQLSVIPFNSFGSSKSVLGSSQVYLGLFRPMFNDGTLGG